MVRNNNSLKRKSKNKPLKKHYAIFCEDKITSCTYFKKFVEKLGINKIVCVKGSRGKSTPKQVLAYAKRFIKEESKEYYKTFIVVDKDKHDCYEKVKIECEKSKKSNKDKNTDFIFIGSNPCFEYFLLLYEEDTNKPFDNCQQIKKYLKKEYDRSIEDNFYYESRNYKKAIKNAKEIKLNKDKQDSENFTDIHILLEELINIAKESNP